MHRQPEPHIDYPREGFVALAHLINVQTHYMSSLYEAIAKKPTRKRQSDLESCQARHFESVQCALATLRKEYDSDEDALYPMVQYAYSLEQRRVAELNSLGV